MEIIKTNCPSCEWPLEFPRDFDNVICNICGTSFRVREYKGNINLAVLGEEPQDRASIEDAENLSAIDDRLAELDEDIEKVKEEMEVLKSNEQIAPLQMGCAFFGMFGSILLILAVFTTVGKNYFGGWLFYLSITAVILLSAMRMRRKMPNPEKIEYFRKERASLEEALAQLEFERTQVEHLKEEVFGEPTDNE
jgi:uncharacterized Zn finger protein (UPF0148 family)